MTPALYPNCDAVTVDEREIEAYRPDGSGECQDETYTKVLTEKGRRENNVLRLNFLLPYFTVQVARLEQYVVVNAGEHSSGAEFGDDRRWARHSKTLNGGGGGGGTAAAVFSPAA